MAIAWKTRVPTRMLHNGRHKLIWYPAGNSFQLFDLENDPRGAASTSADDPDYRATRETMQQQLIRASLRC